MKFHRKRGIHFGRTILLSASLWLPGHAVTLMAEQPGFLIDGLAAFYPLNGDADDLSEGGRHATLKTGSFFGKDRFGNPSSSLRIPSSVGYGAVVPLFRMPSPDYTVSVWFIPPSPQEIPQPSGTRILDHSWGIGRDLTLGINADGRVHWLSADRAVFSISPPDHGQWHQATCVMSNRNLALYINGELQGTRTATYSVSGDPFALYLGSGDANIPFVGAVDDARIYSKALSANEVEALHRIESTFPNSARRATLETVPINGFITSVRIIDGGAGYAQAPKVTISGGGGSGAAAVAQLINGRIVSVDIISPGTGYLTPPEMVIDAPVVPARAARSEAVISNGFVVDARVVDHGSGYAATPNVLLVGGGGSGAEGRAVLFNGSISEIVITNPGRGYVSAPEVLIAGPSPVTKASVGIEVSRVKLKQITVLGRTYVVEATSDFSQWVQVGAPFFATAEESVIELDVNPQHQHFRLRELP